MARRSTAEKVIIDLGLNRHNNSNGHGRIPTPPVPTDNHGDAWEGDHTLGDLPGASPEPYRPIPLPAFPEPVRSYLDAASAAIGCDPAFVAMPMLAVLASAIGNSRQAQLKRGWCEPAILWTATVASSGSTKSPGQDSAVRFPKRRQQAAIKRWELAKAEAGKDGDVPPSARCLVGDTTIEALAPILATNWRGVLVERDELSGWIGSMGQYKQSRGGDASRWIELHGGRSPVIDRRTGEPPTIFLPCTAVSITGTIQPGVLERVISQEYRDSGLLARFLMAYPPRRAKQWTETEVDESLVAAMGRLYDRLHELSPGQDEDGDPAPVQLSLDHLAKRLWVDFVNEHGKETVELDNDLAAAWSKLEGAAARLALVHYLVRCAAEGSGLCDRGPIDLTSIQAGIELSQWFGAEARRIYGFMDASATEKARNELTELIRRNGGTITARELQRKRQKRYESAAEAEAALTALERRGVGAWTPPTSSPNGGHPTREFRLHQRSDR